jgi:hypothetical protein
MNKIYNPKPEDLVLILERPTKRLMNIELTVKEIFKVQKKEMMLLQILRYFDGVTLENQVN